MPDRQNDTNERSEAVHDILGHIPHWMIRYGTTLLFGLVIMLFLLAYFIEYPDVVSAEITITTVTPPEKIVAKNSGKIEAFLAENNGYTKGNEILVVLENTAIYSDVILLRSIIDTLQVDRNNFYFPIDELPTLILGDIATPFAIFETNYYEYLLNRNLNPLSNQFELDQITLIENTERLKILQSQKILSQQEMELKKTDFERSRKLLDEGVIAIQSYEQKQLEFLQAQKAYKDITSAISRIRETVDVSKRRLSGIEIEQIQNDVRLLKSTLQSYYQLKKSILDWENRYTLQSSIEGTVSFLSYWNESQRIEAEDYIFTIIPANNSGYIGKIRAPVQNSGKLRRGQRVNIKLDNYPSTEFGMLNGTLKSISQAPGKEGYYFVDVNLPDRLITTYNKPIEFKQEMRGTADIITQDYRLTDRMFDKLKALLKR